MATEDRSGALRRDRTLETMGDGLRFPFFRHDTADASAAHDRRDRQCEGLRRDFVQRGEPSFTELLTAAHIVQSDDLDESGVLESRDGGIVECKVAVLPDSDAGHVDGMRVQEHLVARNLRFEVGCIALQKVDSRRPDVIKDSFPKIAPETGRMLGRHSAVFIQMKDGDSVPTDRAIVLEGFEEGKL